MPDILHRIGIKAPIDDAYDAFATRDGLAGWWTTKTSGDSVRGGELTFRFGAMGEHGFTMQVLELTPSRRVSWLVTSGPEEWVGTKIHFDLRQDGEFAIVLFTHEGWAAPVEFMHHCSTKWAVFLLSAKAFVETGTGAPEPHDTKIDNWN